MERLIGVWVEELSVESVDGTTLRVAQRLLEALSVLCPFTELVRLGLYVLPARGPSRFFGGEERVRALLASTVREITGHEPRLGAGDGLFVAELAARAGVVVAPGASDDYRRRQPLAVLGRPDLAATGRRLGLVTVGDFADLDPARVAERFPAAVGPLHRLARGERAEAPGQRDARLAARLARLTRAPQRDEQRGFFGQRGAAEERAHAAALRVRRRLGDDAVVVAGLRAGRVPQDRAVLVPWGSLAAPAGSDAAAPWPGHLRPPAPAVVFAHPVEIDLVDATARPVRVDGRGRWSAAPVAVILAPGVRRAVVWSAGPWPSVERWWVAPRRRAHAQVVLEGGEALLVAAESRRWWLAGVYD